ncbi:hypothetical protein OROGR_007091 [Orobanche gracilis]
MLVLTTLFAFAFYSLLSASRGSLLIFSSPSSPLVFRILETTNKQRDKHPIPCSKVLNNSSHPQSQV